MINQHHCVNGGHEIGLTVLRMILLY